MEPVISGMSTCSLALETLISSVNDKASCAVCSVQDKNVISCSNCKLIHYCSVRHQKEHWEIHQKNCFPVMGKSHSELGTVLVATRNIKELELIYKESPILASARTKLIQDDFSAVCFGCASLLKEDFSDCQQFCAHCSWPLCGTDCSKILDHSNFECKVFQNVGLKPNVVIEALKEPGKSFPLNLFYQSVQVLRCLLLRENDLTAWNKLVNITSLLERRKLSPFAGNFSKFVTKFVREFCKLEQYPPDLVDHVFGISFFHGRMKDMTETVEDGTESNLFVSTILEKASKLSHSCSPNSQESTAADLTSTVSAIRDIECGQIITVSLDADFLILADVVARRKYLHANYIFWCSCPKCADPTELGAFSSGVKCHKINKTTKKECDGFYLPLNSLDVNSRWKCTNAECGWLKSHEVLHAETLLPLYTEIRDSKNFEEKMGIMERNSNLTVHENHSYLIYLRQIMITPFALKFLENHDANYLEVLNAQYLELLGKWLDLYKKFGLGIPRSKGEVLFNKALAIERTLPRRSLEQLEGMLQPTSERSEYSEEVTSAVDFVRKRREATDPPMENLHDTWVELKKAYRGVYLKEKEFIDSKQEAEVAH